MSNILIKGGQIVNEGERFEGWIIVRGDRIAEVGRGKFEGEFTGRVIALGSDEMVMPGVIDDHVHFREPGLDWKADMHSESRAAVAGGVTSFMDMPNTKPVTTARAELERKLEIAAVSSLANYSFYLGATNDNFEEVKRADPRTTAGIKLFMGSSTGNMLVDDDYMLSALFAESPMLIAAHCEDEAMIRANSEKFRTAYGDDVTPEMHAQIRSAEACYRSSARAVELADKYGANLHVMHISTERELTLFDVKPLAYKKITAEVCPHHLWFDEGDYADRGNMIKVNPAIKTAADRSALIEALRGGKLDIVGSDHAPHTLDEKQRPYWDCPSGMPSLQHTLAMMLELAWRGECTVVQVVEKMCHAPAVRYAVRDRGFLRAGAYADIVVVSPDDYRLERGDVLYKCGWSPVEGAHLRNRVTRTIVNGNIVWEDGLLNEDHRGRALEFDR